jgi:hypothetical protein
MLEVYDLVPVRKSFLNIFFGVLTLALTILALLLSCMTQFAMPFVLVFGGIWYFLTFRAYKEFEYSYFEGEVRFAKVMNKSRRKSLAVYTMEMVLMIAPAGDRSIYKYEHDSAVTTRDYTSHRKGAPCYHMIVQQDSKIICIRFEPDEKYLEAVEQKYKPKVIRRQEA